MSNDGEIIGRVLAGEVDAFAQIVRLYHTKLYYFVAGKVAVDAEAEDIVQETFVTAYHRIKEFHLDQPLLPWLRGIALNHCRNAWRRYERESRLRGSLLEAKRAVSQAEWLEQRQAGQDERVAALQGCLAGLSQQEKRMVRLRYVEERPVEEIAAELERGAEALRHAMFRMRLRLGECVERKLMQGATHAQP